MPKLKLREVVLGADANTKRWRMNLAAARMAYESGHLKEAQTKIARALAIAPELPDSHERSFALAGTEMALSAVMLAQGHVGDALHRLKKSIVELEGNADPDHKELLAVALRFYAEGLLANGDDGGSEEALKKSLAILRDLGRPALVQLAYTLSDLCAVYLVQSRFADAETHIIEAMNIMAKTVGTEAAEYVRADMIYGACFAMSEDSRMEAIEDSIGKMTYFYGGNHPNIARALHRYFEHLSKAGKTQKLEAAKKRFFADR